MSLMVTQNFLTVINIMPGKLQLLSNNTGRWTILVLYSDSFSQNFGP